jgi:hypothetical protein
MPTPVTAPRNRRPRRQLPTNDDSPGATGAAVADGEISSIIADNDPAGVLPASPSSSTATNSSSVSGSTSAHRVQNSNVFSRSLSGAEAANISRNNFSRVSDRSTGSSGSSFKSVSSRISEESQSLQPVASAESDSAVSNTYSPKDSTPDSAEPIQQGGAPAVQDDVHLEESEDEFHDAVDEAASAAGTVYSEEEPMEEDAVDDE